MKNDLTGLGRLHIPDDRDRGFMLSPPKTAAAWQHWHTTGVFDQGATSQCVAYSGAKYLEASPIVNKFKDTGFDFYTLYKECQKIDQWPGEDYDGTSVRALMKILQSRGYIEEYRWAFQVGPVVDHLLNVGPVIVGTDWTMDMFTPDRWGYITPSGEVVGGHAWTLIGVNTLLDNPDGSKGAVRMVNSWGPGWGQKGRAWVTIRNLDKLIRTQGEAVAAKEIKRVR